MHYLVKNLSDLQLEISKKISELNIKNYSPNIIAVSKTFPIEKIKPIIDYGHIHFGENKVQEATDKWTQIKEYNQLLTTNKIFIERTADVGVMPADVAINFGVTGPTLRGSGVDYDLRKTEPYSIYDKFGVEIEDYNLINF